MSQVIAETTIRPARMEDLDEAVRVLNAFSNQQYGAPDYRLTEVRAEWESDHLDIAVDTRAAFDSDGRMAAFVEFWDDPNGGVEDLQFYLHVVPGQITESLAERLIRFAEFRAESTFSRTDLESIDLATSGWLDHAELRGYLENAGYEVTSYNSLMHIEFDEEPERPKWPDGIAVKRFRLGVDDRAVYETRQEAWADMRHGHPIPFEMWRYYLIENNDHFDESLWFMAMDGDEVAGICLCSPSMTQDSERGWISSVGVKRPYRRRGIASAMLRHGFCELYARGIRKAGLSVDSESLTGANRIYERAGMVPVRQTVNYRKTITE